MSLAYENARANPKRVLFAEGEEPNVLRAAIAFKERRFWNTGSRGARKCSRAVEESLVLRTPKDYEVLNSRNFPACRAGLSISFMERHQRHGMLRREIERMVNQDRNYIRCGNAFPG